MAEALPQDIERPRHPEFLEVEPLQLMHTGGFYLDLTGQNRIAPSRILSFGVSTRKHPETNASLYEYVNGPAPAHKYTRFQATAVYKPGYLQRLGINPADLLAGHVANIHWVPPTDTDGRLDVRAFGDMGAEATAKDVFNWDEIQALILPADGTYEAKEFTAELLSRGLDVPLYIEEPNPGFEEEFRRRFAMVELPVPVDDSRISHTLKGMADVRAAIETLIADPRRYAFETYRMRGGNVAELCERVRAELAGLQGTEKIIITPQFARFAREGLAEAVIDQDIPERRYRLYAPDARQDG